MSFINQRITAYAYINNDFQFLMGILPPAIGLEQNWNRQNLRLRYFLPTVIHLILMFFLVPVYF